MAGGAFSEGTFDVLSSLHLGDGALVPHKLADRENSNRNNKK